MRETQDATGADRVLPQSVFDAAQQWLIAHGFEPAMHQSGDPPAGDGRGR